MSDLDPAHLDECRKNIRAGSNKELARRLAMIGLGMNNNIELIRAVAMEAAGRLSTSKIDLRASSPDPGPGP